MDRIKETAKLQEYALHAWNTFAEIYPRLVKFDCPKIVLNGRFTKSAGMCYYEDNKIDISLKYYIFHEETIISTIIPHELAHQVTWHIFGPLACKKENGHGIEWQKTMIEYGLPADRYHTLIIPPISLAEMLELRK